MPLRAVIAFLVKIIALLLLMLYLWHDRGLSIAYHRLLAGLLSFVYPSLDPAGVVKGVHVEGEMLVVRSILRGATYLLDIVASDITSNMTMLLSLYLASPIRPFAKRYSVCFALALGAMCLIHLITVIASIQYACLEHPLIMKHSPFGSFHARLVVGYLIFYQQYGMYFAAVILWFPYLLSRQRWQRRS